MRDRRGVSRREFVRHAAGGAAALYLGGCAAAPRRGPQPTGARKARRYAEIGLIERDTFRRLADVALNASSADHTLVFLHGRIGGETQFYDNQITDYPADPFRQLSVTVAFGQQVGSGTTSELTADAVAVVVKTAEEKAQAAAPDSGYLPPLPEQRCPVLPTYRPETAAAGRDERSAFASEVMSLCGAQGLKASLLAATHARSVGVAASTALFAFEHRTAAEFQLTSVGSNVLIQAENVHRSIDDLGVVKHARRAVERVKWLAEPRELPAGRYAVILEPRAVAQLLCALLDATDARGSAGASPSHSGGSALGSKLGEAIIDARLTLRNRPYHPDLLGNGFDVIGLASNAKTWIDRGVLTQLYYDRLAAREHEATPSYAPDAPHFSGVDPAAESLEELIRATERGVLVTDLGDVRVRDPADLTLAGTTAGGLFLIEDGEIATGLSETEWTVSPLQAFNAVESYTVPLEAPVRPAEGSGPVTSGLRKMLVPAMVVRDLNFSGGMRS